MEWRVCYQSSGIFALMGSTTLSPWLVVVGAEMGMRNFIDPIPKRYVS